MILSSGLGQVLYMIEVVMQEYGFDIADMMWGQWMMGTCMYLVTLKDKIKLKGREPSKNLKKYFIKSIFF